MTYCFDDRYEEAIESELEDAKSVNVSNVIGPERMQQFIKFVLPRMHQTTNLTIRVGEFVYEDPTTFTPTVMSTFLHAIQHQTKITALEFGSYRLSMDVQRVLFDWLKRDT